MDLLSKIGHAYSSDSDSDDSSQDFNIDSHLGLIKKGEIMKSGVLVSDLQKDEEAQVKLDPEVDVTDLQMELHNKELNKFESTNNVIRK